MPSDAIKSPAISVVMGVYNGERFLAAAVDSILAQTYGDFEFIIVNDGSADRTPAILADYAAADSRVRLLHNEMNIGLSSSLNRGLDAAQGEFIARMDADDVSEPLRFERQVDYLRRHPDVVLLGTANRSIDHSGQDIRFDNYFPLTWQENLWGSCFVCTFQHASVMIRRSVLDAQALRYDAHCGPVEDFELWTRILEVGKGTNLRERLLRRRKGIGGICEQHFGQQVRDHDRVVEQTCRRRFPGSGITDVDARLLRVFHVNRAPDEELELSGRLAAIAGRYVSAFDSLFPRQAAGGAAVARKLRRRMLQHALRRVFSLRRLDPAWWSFIWGILKKNPGLILALPFMPLRSRAYAWKKRLRGWHSSKGTARPC